MLNLDEARSTAEQFGVANAQVQRDHLISHVLAALSDSFADEIIFFGGTALSRTFTPDGRLSEDIDLIALNSRQATAESLERQVVEAVRREFPGIRWEPLLSRVRDDQSAVITTPEGISVRVQLLSRLGYPLWPTVRRALVQRYWCDKPRIS